MRRLLLSAAVLGTLATPALAAEEWTFDASHTHILYEVSHLGYSQNIGEFEDFTGTLILDEQTPANSSVEVTIDLTSLDSGTDALTTHMLGADFFNTEQFGTATFKSTAVEVTGETTARVTGDLTMLGQTHPVTLDVSLRKMGDHPFQENTRLAAFAATTTLDRTQWGMTYLAPNIGSEVLIRIETEVTRPK